MALSEPAAPPLHDTMKMHLSSSAFHQDDLWTACGGYVGENGLLNSDDELTNMVSMVNSLQGNHHNRQQEVFSCGLHRNASFDSGSTSHDSCTASYSTGSPVTVLPPLPFSSCNEGKEQDSSYLQYVNPGLWAAHDHASSDCGQILPSAGGENYSSLLMNELSLRSYDDGVRYIGGNKDYLESVVPASISSHPSYQTSDNSGSTLESSLTGITNSSFCNKILVGHEHDSSEHNSNYSSNPPQVTAATVHCESDISPTGQHRRLSWTDHHWPVSSTSSRMHLPLDNFHSTTGVQPLQLPQHTVNGIKSSTTHSVAPDFQDADYVATCNQFRKTQLREINNSSGTAATNSLKRSYEAMQSTAGSNNSSYSQAVPTVSQSLDKLASASKKQQEAAALSALLYKNNHGSDLIEKLREGSNCISMGSVLGTGGDSTTLQQPPPKMRRRHGTATDPQSIAARTRRERFSDRIKLLQSLVPNGERLDTVSMLGHTLEYVRFLQHQVWQLYNGNDDASIPQPDSESREKWKEFMDTTQPETFS